MTTAGADTFTWDGVDPERSRRANRMSGATVGGTASTYAYDGDYTRVQKTVGGTPTNYVWDRESGLPLMVDDGTNAYLHEDGALAQLNGAGTSEYLLDDAIGSRRGVTNLAGALTGTADYDTFGAVRTSTGTGSAFGYTGEQFDAETGYTYLRARYLNPALGRFTSADTVQPNAPGTQGYNLYAYVANSPTTWVDPSGHEIDPRHVYITAMILARPAFIATSQILCQAIAASVVTAGGGSGNLMTLAMAGNSFAVCQVLVMTVFTIPAISCALDSQCLTKAWGYAKTIRATSGEFGGYLDTPTWDQLKDWSRKWPWLPAVPVVAELLRRLADVRIDFGDPGGGGGGEEKPCHKIWVDCYSEEWWKSPEWGWPGDEQGYLKCYDCFRYCQGQGAWDYETCPERQQSAATGGPRWTQTRLASTNELGCGG